MSEKGSGRLSRFGVPIAIVSLLLLFESILDLYGLGYVVNEAANWFTGGRSPAAVQAPSDPGAAALPAVQGSASAEDVATYDYLLIDERGNRLIRTLRGQDEACPRVWVDGQNIPMRPRRPRARAQFPVQLCEMELEAGQIAWLDGRRLPSWPEPVERIVLLGDTGCRLTYYAAQACNHEARWPFAQVAASAAAEEPDLVVHLGDYHYRETACSDSNPGCSGSAFGDRWAAWEEDFFEPARPLLNAAPWIAVRGNHEDCDRAGNGWLFFLAPEREPSQGLQPCGEYHSPFDLKLPGTAGGGSIRLVVLDTARGAHPGGPHHGALAEWCAQARDVFLAASSTDWLWVIMHQPIDLPYWSPPKASGVDTTPNPYDPFDIVRAVADPNGTATPDGHHCGSEIDAVRQRHASDPPRVMLIGGDTHVFKHIRQADGRRIDVVAGHGGTALDRQERAGGGKLFDVDDAQIAAIAPNEAPEILRWTDDDRAFATLFEHGYAVLDRLDSVRWLLTAKDARGRSRLVCLLDSGARGSAAQTGSQPALAAGVVESKGQALLRTYGCVPSVIAEREPRLFD